MKDAKRQYEYFRKRLLKEAERGGLTSQEAKLVKLIESPTTELQDKEIGKRASKVKAEFKRIRQTKKYKEERRVRNQLYRLVGKYQKEELEREARRRLNKLPPADDQLRGAFFKNLTYEKLMKEGITRKIDNKIVRYKGFEAVKTQIKSLVESTDSERKKQAYINTYIDNLLENGIPESYDTTDANGNPITRYPIKEMRAYLESLSPKMITFALDMGHIHSIQYYYIITDSDIEAFIQKIDYWTSPEANQKLSENFNRVNAETQKMMRVIKKEKELQMRANLGARPHKNY